MNTFLVLGVVAGGAYWWMIRSKQNEELKGLKDELENKPPKFNPIIGSGPGDTYPLPPQDNNSRDENWVPDTWRPGNDRNFRGIW